MSFAALLAPLTVAELREGHWARRSLLLPRREERFSGLPFDFDVLCAALAQSAGARVKVQYRDRAGAHCEMPITPAQMDGSFRAGMTVCIDQVDAHLPPLRAAVAGWRRSLPFVGAMSFSGYWSPDGSGFGVHYDDRPVFVCQLRGSKRWSYSREPAVAEPKGNVVYTPEATAEMRHSGVAVAEPADLESAVLQPGDVLYLPAGAWHATDAVGESLSLTLRIFDAAPVDAARACLEQLFERDAAWRRPLPLVSRSEMAEGETHEAVRGVLAERLAALQSFVVGLSVSEMERAWGAACARDAEPVGALPIDQADRLALREGVVVERATGTSGEACFRVIAGPHEMELSVRENGWFEKLISAGEFRASEMASWAEPEWLWDDARATLEELVARGVVRVVA